MTSIGYTFEDEQKFRHISWQWAHAYDTKDWALLKAICTHTVRFFYKEVNPNFSDGIIPREDYCAFVSADTALGDSRVKTHHLLGAVHFDVVEPNVIAGDWQCQACHQREFADGTKKTWTTHAYVKHYYEKVDGVWAFAGIKPHTVLLESVGKLTDVIGHFE